MDDFEVGGELLGRIHGDWNAAKIFAHFTGFLEGIVSSGLLECKEVEPLIEESHEFWSQFADCDANDIIEDSTAELLEYQTLTDMVEVRKQEIDPECSKSSINRFLGFCRGIVCDGEVTTKEAQEVLRKIEAQPELLDVVGVRQVQLVCLDAVEDGIVDALESNSICDVIGEIVGDTYCDTGIVQTNGVANFKEFKFNDISLDLEGRVVVLTGKFQATPRSKFEDQLAELGAIIKGSVSKKTDFLIVGGEASRDWIEMHRGTKMRKAHEILRSLPNPRFVSESQILRLL